jgi:pimeloyl-ACP methyl ester carboxylesterase
MDRPETRYARSGDVNIAYQVTGDGPIDIVYVPSVAHHVELNWENSLVARFFERLAALGRLILFDKRGTGMSDPVSDFPTLETRMDDIRAVMDAADSDSAVVFASGEGGPLGMLFAATYPERTRGLVLFNTTPCFARSAELPWLSSRGQYEAMVDEVSRRWGEVAFNEEFARRSNPEASDAEISAFARVFRLSVSPGAAAHYMRMNADVDVSDVLTSIRVPTLIVHSAPPSPTGRSVAPENAHFLASRIPVARLAEVPGEKLRTPACGSGAFVCRT